MIQHQSVLQYAVPTQQTDTFTVKLCPIKVKVNPPSKIANLFHFQKSLSYCFQSMAAAQGLLPGATTVQIFNTFPM